MRCKIGDLAVVVVATNKCNIGKIVRVIAPHTGRGDLVIYGAGHVWLVQSFHPLVWTSNDRKYIRKAGPAPDSSLIPIRDCSAPKIALRENRRLWKRQLNDAVEVAA